MWHKCIYTTYLTKILLDIFSGAWHSRETGIRKEEKGLYYFGGHGENLENIRNSLNQNEERLRLLMAFCRGGV